MSDRRENPGTSNQDNQASTSSAPPMRNVTEANVSISSDNLPQDNSRNPRRNAATTTEALAGGEPGRSVPNTPARTPNPRRDGSSSSI